MKLIFTASTKLYFYSICHKFNQFFLQGDLKFFIKRGNKFFEIFKSPPIDWCKMVTNKSRAMNFQKVLIKSLQTSAPSLIHPCPYAGKYSALNISAPKDIVEFFPIGTFRLNLKIYDSVDNNIVTFNLNFEVFKV